MQQIDEIRKMSELARTLRANGLAKDNLDAIQQAQSVTSSDPQVVAQRKQEQWQQTVELLQRKADSQQKRIEELQSTLEQVQRKIATLEITRTTAQAPMQDRDIPTNPWAIPKTIDKPAATTPIDRNGVAPADVSIEKFFYFGKR